MKTAVAAIVLIGAPLLAGAAGALATTGAPSFYARLVKPSWSPPASAFGPVWSALFLLMGIAAFLVWKKHGWESARGALTLFLVQLVVNALWSWLFFHWRLGIASIADIALLLLLLIVLIAMFAPLRPLSAVLMAPYLAWVGFATALNVAVVTMNPDLFSR